MKGKGLLAAVILALTLFVTANSSAQGLKLAVNVGGVLPTSDLKDIAAAGFAVNVYLAKMLGETIGVEGHVGYHKFGSEAVSPGLDLSGAFVPLKIGLVKLWGASRRFYTNPSLGVYRGASDFNASDFGMGPRIGYLFPLGESSSKLDVGVEFHNVFSDPNNSRYFGVTIGAVFNLAAK